MKKIKKLRGFVIGYYNERGYEVDYIRAGVRRTVYSAGNHWQDSQSYVWPGSPAATPLAQLKKFCAQTAREIAAERGARFARVEYE